MAATVTTLDRAIADEERIVGLPTDRPLTDAAISRRHVQIAAMLLACGFLAVFAACFASGQMQILAIALAVFFGLYSVEKDRHLRRLCRLRGDSLRITLVVAGELLYSGALHGDRELLDLRESIARSAGRLAAGLADVVPSDCARVRMIGPSGEVPIAAERELAPIRPVPVDETAARAAVRERAPVRKLSAEGRSLLVVPLRRANDVVGLLEAVAPGGVRYAPADAALVDAYARGAIAALLSPPASS
jgi:hypothetical protein